MKHKGYNEWKAEGYQVRRGEHMRFRDERGVPMFSEEQVDVIVPRCFSRSRYLRDFRSAKYGYDQFADYDYEGSWHVDGITGHD